MTAQVVWSLKGGKEFVHSAEIDALGTRRVSVWLSLVLFLLVTAVIVKAGDFTYGDYTYTINYDNTITITDYTGPGGEVVIPSAIEGKPVTKIGNYAFSGNPFVPNTSLTNVTIPDSVISIRDYVFSACSSLTNVTIGNSVTSIGEASFSSCTSLMSVTIPDSVTSIGGGTFSSCIRLTSVMIGNGLTSIGSHMFDACFSLISITVGEGNSVYSSVDGVVFDKSQATLIQYPRGKSGSYMIPDSVTSIGEQAFLSCHSLTSVTIPYSVTNIGSAAFDSCTNLTSVNIPNGVASIGYSAFSACSSLTSVTIPDSVISIEDYVFSACSSLTSVTIPDSVTSIGARAFFYCLGLTSMTIGTGVTSIRSYVFADCASLRGTYFRGNAPSIGSDVFDGNDIATVYYLPGTTGWGATFGGRPTALWNRTALGPTIKANGAKGEIIINYPENLSVTMAMDAGDYVGVPVDWWILACAGSAGFYLNSSGQWTQFDDNISNCHPKYQGGLFNLPAVEVLNARGLQPGSYTFWFAVDYPMDGILNIGGYILLDSVNVTVQ